MTIIGPLVKVGDRFAIRLVDQVYGAAQAEHIRRLGGQVEANANVILAGLELIAAQLNARFKVYRRLLRQQHEFNARQDGMTEVDAKPGCRHNVKGAAQAQRVCAR